MRLAIEISNWEPKSTAQGLGLLLALELRDDVEVTSLRGFRAGPVDRQVSRECSEATDLYCFAD
jgi:hypothetical protein